MYEYGRGGPKIRPIIEKCQKLQRYEACQGPDGLNTNSTINPSEIEQRLCN